MEQHYPAGLLQILLIRAGIESNPGPRTWYCSVCKDILRRNQTSVKCNNCEEWCHLRPCSGLQSHKQWNSSYTSQCCTNMISRSPTVNNSIPIPDLNQLPLGILQFNCNGLRDKIHDIVHFMTNNNIKIAAIQESKLNQRIDLTIPCFDIIRNDRDHDSGGGLAFIIHKDVQYYTINLPAPPPSDETIEQLGIAITLGNDAVSLVNLYIPPPHNSFLYIKIEN
uniref:Endonuclease/exonuclease/phosphatase domain-containing protein n=1 Tax=Cacopsylla melanoneura TaxID=428564 RepID=A0A8D8X0Y9_9HEMI